MSSCFNPWGANFQNLTLRWRPQGPEIFCLTLVVEWGKGVLTLPSKKQPGFQLAFFENTLQSKFWVWYSSLFGRLARFRFWDLGWMVTESISWHNWGLREDLLHFQFSQFIPLSLPLMDPTRKSWTFYTAGKQRLWILILSICLCWALQFQNWRLIFWICPLIDESLPVHQPPLQISHLNRKNFSEKV